MDNLTDQQKTCIKCAECCEYVEFPVTMLNVEVIDYFMNRGNQFYINEAGVTMFRLYDPCVHLKDGLCDIYDTRPTTCRSFMCKVKDKTIKDIKDQACKDCMGKVRTIIEQQKKQEQEKNDI